MSWRWILLALLALETHSDSLLRKMRAIPLAVGASRQFPHDEVVKFDYFTLIVLFLEFTQKLIIKLTL